MPMFKVTAEHVGGASVAHMCRDGVYTDPVDGFTELIDAESMNAAEERAREILWANTMDAVECDCSLARTPGSTAWWESVAFHAEPVEEQPAAEPSATWAVLGDPDRGQVVRIHGMYFSRLPSPAGGVEWGVKDLTPREARHLLLTWGHAAPAVADMVPMTAEGD